MRDALLLRRSRSFRADAIRSIQTLGTRPKIIHSQNIPQQGPGLLVTNHYTRPGFDTWWIALGISAAVPVEIHWMMTNGWNHFGSLGRVTRWLFPKLAGVYGFTPTPPMPPDPAEVADRARAVRQVLKAARRPGVLIGLAPEGRDQPGGVLGEPPPGSGRFVRQLMKNCRQIVPVGVYEDGEGLCLSFGPKIEWATSLESTSSNNDEWVARRMMAAIAQQLPERLRGIYGQ